MRCRMGALAAVAAIGGCEGIPGGTPTPLGRDRAPAAAMGQGCDALVPIAAADTAEGVARERAWLADAYPGFEVLNESRGECGDVPVDRVVFVHEGVERTVLFDTSAFYGRIDGENLDELLDG